MQPDPERLLDLAGVAVCRYLLAHRNDYAGTPIQTPPDLVDWLRLLCFARLPARLCPAAPKNAFSWQRQSWWAQQADHQGLVELTFDLQPMLVHPAGAALLAEAPAVTACLAAGIDWLAARLPLFDLRRFATYTDLARLWVGLRDEGWLAPVELGSALELIGGHYPYSLSAPGYLDPADSACWANLHRLDRGLDDWFAPFRATFSAPEGP